MSRTVLRLIGVGSVALLAACGSSTTASSTTSVTSTPASSASSTGSAAQQGTADPCTLLTQQEASTLSGLAVGPGRSSVIGQARECFLRAPTGMVLLMVQGGDAAAAKAAYQGQKGSIPPQLHITEVPNFHDGAFIVKVGTGASGGAKIYVLAGATFFSISCAGAPGCSDAQLMSAATTMAGRLP